MRFGSGPRCRRIDQGRDVRACFLTSAKVAEILGPFADYDMNGTPS